VSEHKNLEDVSKNEREKYLKALIKGSVRLPDGSGFFVATLNEEQLLEEHEYLHVLYQELSEIQDVSAEAVEKDHQALVQLLVAKDIDHVDDDELDGIQVPEDEGNILEDLKLAVSQELENRSE